MGSPARPVARPLQLNADDLSAQPQLEQILVEHASRGARVQVVVRLVLVVFVCLVVIVIPPAHGRVACWTIAGVYAVWSLLVIRLSQRRDRRVLRLIWLALLVDLATLAALTVVASNSVHQTWTADVLVNGFFILPVLAATSLRPHVSATVAIPTAIVYFGASVFARQANGEPWSSVILRSLAMVGVCLGCFLLSRLQRSRVQMIGGLVAERGALLDELITVGARERQDLAEELHDGALQYVLAARQDLPEEADALDEESIDRIDHALARTVELLRSTVGQLHPAVLDQVGLLAAVRGVAETVATRGGFRVDIDASAWSSTVRTSADPVLLSVARELLTNVAKHAQAEHVQVRLSSEDDRARLTVSDDGRGIAPGELERQLARGHIGIVSQRVRLEAAGGRLTLRPGPSGGTIAEAEMPAPPV